ncbi:PREDICTED: probable serine/threonine-protein kinase NAK isoform X2 [Populus euphratica]|uniref:Probable serine/threonine-protein kinase NAK isoform X2 n=1 Tax=Populus euphratica TaxID=75702 RepID=A0AAJ6XBP7_POPEU|nr:PREDICTED: probable serine/threonine-protein kinase NAK isoform X2 [Populus euphratica]
MGICCSCLAHKPATTLGFQDPTPSTNDHVSAGGDDFDNSRLSMISTSITTWISQPSSSFTAIWGKNVPESSQFSDATGSGDGTLPNGQSATNLRVFTLAQVRAATYNFRSDLLLGTGGFGNVYKGWLKEKLPPRGIKKTAVAVKKSGSYSTQGFNEWKAEVYFLGLHSHPNLVKLLGYCLEERSVPPLSWDIRLKIAIDAARGLAYLHTLEKPVIYRDFKSSNILLDEYYNAKLADFGLSFWGPLIDSHVNTRITGTKGYIDPQYLATGNLHVKSDVYGFGVLVVEMLTGVRAVDTKRPSGKQILVDWVKPYLKNRRKLRKIMDSRLEGKYPPGEASHIAHLAIKCLQIDTRFRPSMTEIAETLEQIDAIHMRLGERKILSG